MKATHFSTSAERKRGQGRNRGSLPTNEQGLPVQEQGRCRDRGQRAGGRGCCMGQCNGACNYTSEQAYCNRGSFSQRFALSLSLSLYPLFPFSSPLTVTTPLPNPLSIKSHESSLKQIKSKEQQANGQMAKPNVPETWQQLCRPVARMQRGWDGSVTWLVIITLNEYSNQKKNRNTKQAARRSTLYLAPLIRNAKERTKRGNIGKIKGSTTLLKVIAHSSLYLTHSYLIKT